MGILFGLGAALSWGPSDFLGGRFTQKYPAFTVGLVSQSSSLLALLILAAVVRPDVRGDALLWGLAAGVFTGFGGMSLYQGLATGDSAVVAPLSACGAVVPVAFAFATGDAPTALQSSSRPTRPPPSITSNDCPHHVPFSPTEAVVCYCTWHGSAPRLAHIQI